MEGLRLEKHGRPPLREDRQKCRPYETNVNAAGRTGWTALHNAAMSNEDPGVLTVLFENGANIDAANDNGDTSLAFAALHGKPMHVQVLMDAGANVGDNEFLRLCRMGTAEAVERAIRNGANMNAVSKTHEGSTALHYAVWQNPDHGVLTLLIENGTLNIDVTDDDGNTPLMIAAAQYTKKDDIIRALIKEGANVNTAANDGRTPLMFAAYGNSNTDHLTVLIEEGADVNAADNDGRTPLMWAALNDDATPDFFMVLIEAGADISAKNNSGKTAYDIRADEYSDMGQEIQNLLQVDYDKE